MHPLPFASPRVAGPLALLAATLLLPACAIGTQKTGRVIDTKKIARVKVGASTKQDVLDLFGPPTTYDRVASFPFASLAKELRDAAGGIDAKAAEDVFTYTYTEDNERFFTVLLYTYFSRDVIADTLMVFFDVNDVVKYVAFAKQTEAEPEPAGGD